MTAVLVGVGWAIAVALFIGIVVAINILRGWRLADRMLGPGSSSTDLQLGLMVALDEAGGPPAERRRR